MEPNPYETPRERGYHPPIKALLSVHQSGVLMAYACGGMMLTGAAAFAWLPEIILGVSRLWVVVTVHITVMIGLWSLLMLGRAAGLVAKPVPRSKS